MATGIIKNVVLKMHLNTNIKLNGGKIQEVLLAQLKKIIGFMNALNIWLKLKIIYHPHIHKSVHECLSPFMA
jgi:hypothetical protein